MQAFETIFNSDYFDALVGFLPPLVLAGMVLPFAPWVCGMMWSAFYRWVTRSI